MEETKKTRQQETLEAILNLPLEKDCPNLMNVIIPRGNKVMVMKKSLAASATRSGIHIPASNNSHLPVGLIVALGPECKEDLRVGQLVWYNMACNITQWIEGEEYIMMYDIDVYHHYNPNGKVFLVDGAVDVHQKDIKRAEVLKQNENALKVMQGDHDNKIDKIRDEAEKRKRKGIIR